MYRIAIQRASRKVFAPTALQLRHWAKAALKNNTTHAEMTIRIVNEKEITALNGTYRHKEKPTNVLSFPFEMPAEVDFAVPLLGDIVICAAVVNQEASDQQKSLDAHWAHIVIHGTLHLLGHDHEIEADAIQMESKEIEILKHLGYRNPYEINNERQCHD